MTCIVWAKTTEAFFKISSVKQVWNNMSFLFKRRKFTLSVKRQTRQCLNVHLIAQLRSFLQFPAGFATVQTAGIINVGIISPVTKAAAMSPLLWTGLFAN